MEYDIKQILKELDDAGYFKYVPSHLKEEALKNAEEHLSKRRAPYADMKRAEMKEFEYALVSLDGRAITNSLEDCYEYISFVRDLKGIFLQNGIILSEKQEDERGEFLAAEVKGEVITIRAPEYDGYVDTNTAEIMKLVNSLFEKSGSKERLYMARGNDFELAYVVLTDEQLTILRKVVRNKHLVS